MRLHTNREAAYSKTWTLPCAYIELPIVLGNFHCGKKIRKDVDVCCVNKVYFTNICVINKCIESLVFQIRPKCELVFV